MNRIQSESFERLLKDKYDVDWIGDIVGNGVYIKEKYTQNEHIASEHELIGIMVTELFTYKDNGNMITFLNKSFIYG